MKRSVVGLCIALLMIPLFTVSSFAQTDDKAKEEKVPLTSKQIYEKWKSSVFTLTTPNGQGTGFVWRTFMLMTCFHVIDQSTLISCKSEKTFVLDSIISYNKQLDYAILKDYILGEVVTLGTSSTLNVGDRLTVIGSPEGLEQTVTEGILSAKRTIDGVEYLQLSVPVSEGSSGSPVFNCYGEVVGMVVGSMKQGQQLNFAISIDSISNDWTWGVPLSDLFKASSELDDVCKPSDSPLSQAPSFSILIEYIPDELKGSFTENDVYRWVEAELSRSAPKAKIVTDTEQSDIFKRSPFPSTVKEYLAHRDRPYLYVNIGFMSSGSTSFYTCKVAFNRWGVFTFGTYRGALWNKSSYGLFGSRYDKQTIIREAVQELVKEFADEWVIANKGNK